MTFITEQFNGNEYKYLREPFRASLGTFKSERAMPDMATAFKASSAPGLDHLWRTFWP
jgi:hypothetical protein